MLGRALPDLREQDFTSLVTNSVSERRDLEFKRGLPGASDSEVKEFLADATSLANAQGGDLIFGVDDRGGVATAVPGISSSDEEGAQLRLENIIRDGIEPRLAVKFQWVPLDNGKSVLVLRVPASLAAPHRIRFKNSGKFYSRNSKGKYEMDVQELRHAFTESEAMPQRLRQFHEEAVANANGADMPFTMPNDPTAVFSIMPLGILRDRRDIALTHRNTLAPVGMDTASWLPMIEGLLWHTPPNTESTVRSYTLTHRTGRIHAAWTIGAVRNIRSQSMLVVWPGNFEGGVTEIGTFGMDRLKSYGLEGPWVITVTLLRMKGAMILREGESSRAAWRERVRLPELILDHVSKENLHPLFKAFWLVFGMIRAN